MIQGLWNFSSDYKFDGKNMNFASDNVNFNQTTAPITSNIMSTEVWFYSDGGGQTDAVIATRKDRSV